MRSTGRENINLLIMDSCYCRNVFQNLSAQTSGAFPVKDEERKSSVWRYTGAEMENFRLSKPFLCIEMVLQGRTGKVSVIS